MNRMTMTDTLAQCQVCGRVEDISLDPAVRAVQEMDHRLDNHPDTTTAFVALSIILDPLCLWPQFPPQGRKVR